MALLNMAFALAAFLALLGHAASESSDTESLLRRALHLEPNAHLQQLAKISDAEGSLARTYLSPAHRRAAEQIQRWMSDCGMESWVDAVGNVHGRIRSTHDGMPTLLLGSHYDTVLDGGAYDGALGIIVGLAAVKGMLLGELRQRGMLGRLPEQPDAEAGDVVIPPTLASSLLRYGSVQLVAFADEEGVRFGSTFLGSRAVAGTLLKYDMLAARDRSGASLEQVLRDEAGLADPRVAVAAAALDPGSISEYVEVHIEQGPVLESRRLALGVVAGIAGQTRLWVDVNGTQGHAGTVPMAGRRDALAAAAEMVGALEALCGRREEEGGAAEDENLVCTVGELKVWPGASNVIAGSTGFSVDIRAKTDPLRNRVVGEAVEAMRAIAARRGVGLGVERKHDAAAVLADADVMDAMRAAAQSAEPILKSALTEAELGRNGGLLSSLREVPVLVSGAGHDAMAIAESVPRMGMLFVRCRGGVSHSPLEHVEAEDVTASSAAMAGYLWGRLVGGVLGPKREAPEPADDGAGAGALPAVAAGGLDRTEL